MEKCMSALLIPIYSNLCMCKCYNTWCYMHVCTGNYELMSKKGAVLARPKNAGHNFIQQTSSPGRHARLRNPIIRAKYWWANYSTLELPLSKADSCVCV